ncbi:uncharacterized protein LOC113759681 [Coffea eugenioides]|uniref:uncharacterized protein LOC113759681 n=1 Tax=Coffea eugenioides TaxID=49369 RepID=UPI000F613B34|nr:uncharacterized protein LOC113759681 [Coffea eugenioides]
MGEEDAVEEINKLSQSSTVLVYQEKFEELRSIVMIQMPELTESYYISSFLSGLKGEIKSAVKMHRPNSLQTAFEIARWKEHHLELVHKFSKTTLKSALHSTSYEPAKGMHGVQDPGANRLMHFQQITARSPIRNKFSRRYPQLNFSAERITTYAIGVEKNLVPAIVVKTRGFT